MKKKKKLYFKKKGFFILEVVVIIFITTLISYSSFFMIKDAYLTKNIIKKYSFKNRNYYKEIEFLTNKINTSISFDVVDKNTLRIVGEEIIYYKFTESYCFKIRYEGKNDYSIILDNIEGKIFCKDDLVILKTRYMKEDEIYVFYKK